MSSAVQSAQTKQKCNALLMLQLRPGHARSWLCAIAQEGEFGVVVGAALHFGKPFGCGEACLARLFHHRERAGAEPATLARGGEGSFGQSLPIARIEKNERERRERSKHPQAGGVAPGDPGRT